MPTGRNMQLVYNVHFFFLFQMDVEGQEKKDKQDRRRANDEGSRWHVIEGGGARGVEEGRE